MDGTDLISSLDAMFLALEEGGVHMHVTTLLIFEAAPLLAADGTLDVPRIRRYMAESVSAAPHFRQRLAWVPILQSPIWVDDASFDPDTQIRHAHLEAPGDETQLKRAVGAISSERLSRQRPLWELTILEGLSDGRFAMVLKIHHVMLDGRAGVEALAAFFGLVAAPQSSAPQIRHGAFELVRRELARRVSAVRELGSWLRKSVALDGWHSLRELAQGVRVMLRTGLCSASPTPLNPPRVSPRREVEWTSFPLAEARARRLDGATVNDVLLAAVTGMTRSYLSALGLAVSTLDLRATVPVGIERSGGRTNATVGVIAPLPIAEPTPSGRLRQVSKTMRTLKRSRQRDAMDLIGRISDIVSHRLLAEGLKAAIRHRPGSLVVSNVVGPPVALSILGARLLAIYPFAPLNDTQALTLAFISYDGQLFSGLHADPEAVGDLAVLRGHLGDAFAELPTTAPLA